MATTTRTRTTKLTQKTSAPRKAATAKGRPKPSSKRPTAPAKARKTASTKGGATRGSKVEASRSRTPAKVVERLDVATVPGLGTVTRDDLDRLCSKPVRVAALGRKVVFELEGYDDDAHREDFHVAIANLLSQGRSILTDASVHVYQYCRDSLGDAGDDDMTYEQAVAAGLRKLRIAKPDDVWKHVRLGDALQVCRDHGRGRDVYLSLECNCAWEPEHGMQLVFKNGLAVSKVGPYDGHVTLVSAYANPKLAGMIYKSR